MHCDEPSLKPKLAGPRNVEMLARTASAAGESRVLFERLGMESLYFRLFGSWGGWYGVECASDRKL
jgi:hypothetical protein